MGMHWFRRHRRVLMAVLVGVLMAVWGTLPALNYFARRGREERGEIRGEPVSNQAVRQAAMQLEKCARYGLLNRASPIGEFIFTGQQGSPREGGRITFEAAWRYLVLVREVEAAGIQVTSEDIENVFAFTGLAADDPELRRAVGNLLKILKLYTYHQESAQLGVPELWMDYDYWGRSAKVRLVELKPEVFLPLVDATPEEVLAFYEEHKDLEPDPRAGMVGYRAPESVRLDYAFAPREDFKGKVSVSDEEVAAYYEEHKAEFVILQEAKPRTEEPDEEAAGEADEQGQAEQNEEAEATPEEAEEAPEEAEEAAEEAEEPAEELEGTPEEAEGPPEAAGEKEDEPAYRPLAEVQENIRDRLLTQKAADAVRERVEKMLDDLERVAGQYVNQPFPLELMANRHDLRYESPSNEAGEAWLTRKQVQLRLPGGPTVAARIFEEGMEVNSYGFLQTPRGPVVFQVLERRPPESRPFEEVRDQAKRDLLQAKALERAQTVAEKLKNSAAESSLDEALREMNERLAKLLGMPEPEGDGRDEGEEGEGEATAGASVLELRETDFLSRNNTYILAVGKGRPSVVRVAFELAAEELAVVTEGHPDPACYVIEKLAEKPADTALFHEGGEFRRAFASFRRRRQAVRDWLDGLLEESPAPSEAEK